MFVLETLVGNCVLPRPARDRGKKLRYLRRIAEKSDNFCLQETHGRIEHLANIDIVLHRAIGLNFATFSTGNVNAAGSVILTHYDILGPGTIAENEGIFPGRDHLVRIRLHDCHCRIINLHYQPEWTLQELRQRLRARATPWPAHPEGVGFLVGDFNVYDPAEGRLNSRTQTFNDGDASRAAALFAAFLRSVEIAHPFFIREDVRRDGPIHTFTRIDRVFLHLPMAELRDFRCQTHTIGTIGDISVPSDHIPVWLVIECPCKKQSDHPIIQRWLTQRPLFVSPWMLSTAT